MPLKLYPPRPGKTPNWSIRGTYLGVRVDRSAGTSRKPVALRELRRIEQQIEAGRYDPAPEKTFADAVCSYVKKGGDPRFLGPLLERLGLKPLSEIDQDVVDATAEALYPHATNATRNRQVYTPVSAVLRCAKVEIALSRPKGHQGTKRSRFLQPAEAERLLAAARRACPEFGAYLTLLLYTGLRLSEPFSIKRSEVWLEESYLYCGKTKNGDPRAVHLPPAAVRALAALPQRRKLRIRRRRDESLADWKLRVEEEEDRLFTFRKGRLLYQLFNEARAEAGLRSDVTFHILRHTYGAWMRRYAGMGARELLETGAWKDIKSVMRYDHAETTEEARKADLLPEFGTSGESVDQGEPDTQTVEEQA